MRFGLSVPPFGPFADPSALGALSQDAERAGWDGFFVWDHIMFDPTFHPVADPWIGLAAVAMHTERIRLGTLITPLARRRPWKVARETVSLDRLSGGRLVLGVGLGDPVQWDFGFFGEETDAKVRAARLDEALEVLDGLWSGRPFSFSGQHFRLDEVTFLPTPVQQPRIPVWVGGWWPNPRPLRRAVRWDGAAMAKWGEPMTPAEVGELAVYAVGHRSGGAPFDVVVSGTTDGDGSGPAVVAPYERAGATWWVEDVSPWRFGAAWESQWRDEDTLAMRRRVHQGPPRG